MVSTASSGASARLESAHRAPTGGEFYRIADLADASHLTIDTIRYYQALGLISPPARRGRIAFYGSEHLDQLQRIRRLRESGWSLKAISQIPESEPHIPTTSKSHSTLQDGALKPFEVRYFSLEELVRQTSVPEQIVRSLVLQQILRPATIDGAEYFNSVDVVLAKAALSLLESGIPMAALLKLAATYQFALDQVLDDAVSLFEQFVRNPIRSSRPADGDFEQPATELLRRFDEIFQTSTTLVAAHFQKELLNRSLAFIVEQGDQDELAVIFDRIQIRVNQSDRN